MLKNAPTLAIVAVHTEENEPPRILIWNTTNIYIHYLIHRDVSAAHALLGAGRSFVVKLFPNLLLREAQAELDVQAYDASNFIRHLTNF